MNKEVEEAKERLDRVLKYLQDNYKNTNEINIYKDIETLLNYIEDLEQELSLKDKVIDEMAEDIFQVTNANCNYDYEKYENIQEVKQWFIDKVRRNK